MKDDNIIGIYGDFILNVNIRQRIEGEISKETYEKWVQHQVTDSQLYNELDIIDVTDEEILQECDVLSINDIQVI